MQSSHQQSWQAQEKQRGRARLARDLRRLAIVLALLVLAAILLVFLFPPFFAPQTHLVLLGSQNRDNFNAPPIAFVGEDLLALESIQEAKVSNHSELWGAAHTAKGLGKHLGNVGLNSSDNLIVYLAAHGISDDENAYLLCDNFDLRRPSSGRIAVEDLVDQVSELKVATKLILLNAGTIQYDPRLGMVANEFPRLLERAVHASDDPSLWIYCSHSSLQYSHVSESARRSVFGMFVGEGLKGAADIDRDGKIKLSELVGFTSANVSRWVTQSTDRGAAQVPKLMWGGGKSFVSDPQLLTLFNRDQAQELTVDSLIEPLADAGTVASVTPRSGQLQGLIRRRQVTLASNKKSRPSAEAGAEDEATAGAAKDGGAETEGAPAGGAAAEGTEGGAAEGEGDQPANEQKASDGAAKPGDTDKTERPKQLLANVWRLRDESAENWSSVDPSLSPIENMPHLWREFQAELLGFEERIRGGIAFDPETIESILEDTFPSKKPTQPGAESVVDSLFQKSIDEDSMLTTAIKPDHASSLALAELAALSQGVTLGIDVEGLQAALEKGSRKELDEWLKTNWREKDNRYYELAFLKRLTEATDLDWDLMQVASRTCLAGERVAALDLLSTDWVRADVERADQLRFFAEQLIFDRVGLDWPTRARKLFEEAEAIYVAAEDAFVEVRKSQWLRDALLARIPSYLRWNRMAGSGSERRAKNYQNLSALLDQMAEFAGRLDQPRTTRIAELVQMRDGLETLQARIEGECGDASAERLLGRSPSPGDSYRAGLLLKTSLLKASARNELLSVMDGLDRQLASGYDLAKVTKQDLAKEPFADTSASPSLQEWSFLFEQARLEYRFAGLSPLAGADTGSESDSSSKQTVGGAFNALESAHRVITDTLTASQESPIDSTKAVNSLWAAHATFGAALQSFYRSTGQRLDVTIARPTGLTRKAIRSLRMLDARDAWKNSRVDVDSISLDSRVASTLQWQAKRLGQATLYRSGNGFGLPAGLSETEGLSVSVIRARQDQSIAELEGCFNVASIVELQYGDADEVLVELHNKGEDELVVSLSVDYERDLIDVTPSIPRVDQACLERLVSLEFLNSPTEFGTRRSDAIRIASNEKCQVPIRITRRGNASEPTKLVVDVFRHASLSDFQTRPPILLGRQELDVVLPVAEVFVQHGEREFISGTNGLKLLPYPNRLGQFMMGVVNYSSKPKNISMSCYSLGTPLTDGMPSDPSKLLIGANPMATFVVNAPGDGKPAFPSTGEAETSEPEKEAPKEEAPKEEDAAAKPIKSTAMPHGMLVVLTDVDTGQMTFRNVSFAVQRPRRFVSPRVDFDATKNQIIVEVTARHASLIPAGAPVRVSCSLPEDTSGATKGKLQGQITEDDPTARMFIAMSTPPPYRAQVNIEVDGYPRAFIFDVPCGKHRTNIPEVTELVDLRMATSSKNGVLAATKTIPVAVQVDTPVGSFEDGRDQLELGIDSAEAGIPDPGNLVRLTTDRSVNVGFVKSLPTGMIELNSVVSDFLIDLPVERLENLNIGVAANLMIDGRETRFDSIPLLIDTASPIVGPVNRADGLSFANVNSTLELSAWAWDEGSGVMKVEAAFDVDGSGEFPEAGQVFAGLQTSNREWSLTVDSGADVGKKTLLVRGVDRVGNVSDPVLVDVDVVSLTEGATRVKAQTVEIVGTILMRKKPVPQALVKLTAIPDDPAAEPGEPKSKGASAAANGRYQIADVPPGSYQLAARAVIRNVVHRIEMDIVVTPGPKRTMQVNVELP